MTIWKPEDARINKRIDLAVAEVFATLLGKICEPCTGDYVGDFGGDVISASIDIVGPCGMTCSVTVRASGAAALEAALLGKTVNTSENMLPDTVGELCNMIAGILKGLLVVDDKHTLSTPRTGTPKKRCSGSTEYVNHRTYRWDDHVVSVALYL